MMLWLAAERHAEGLEKKECMRKWDRNYSSPIWSFAECGMAYHWFPDDMSCKLVMKENTAYIFFQMFRLLIVTCLAWVAVSPRRLRWETVFLALSAKPVNLCMSRQGHETRWRRLWDQSRHMNTSRKTNLKCDRVHHHAHISKHSMHSIDIYIIFFLHIYCFSRHFVGYFSTHCLNSLRSENYT